MLATVDRRDFNVKIGHYKNKEFYSFIYYITPSKSSIGNIL